MKYSKRVTAISELINSCRCLCDVGCDHGYVGILCCEKNKAERVIASDINKEPLRKAKDNIETAGLSGRIETILSDGFKSVPAVFDAACICGMGGLLIKDILKAGNDKLGNVDQMILGPHSEADELRKFIEYETDFCVNCETVIIEDGKFYSLLDLRRKANDGSVSCQKDSFLMFGAPSVQKDKASYREMLLFESEKRKKALSELSKGCGSRAAERRDILNKELSWLKELLNYIGE